MNYSVKKIYQGKYVNYFNTSEKLSLGNDISMSQKYYRIMPNNFALYCFRY